MPASVRREGSDHDAELGEMTASGLAAGERSRGPWTLEGHAAYAAKVLLLAGVYFASAKLGLELAFETRSVTAIWPPTGIALAALVLWGPRLWPGVALGALLANCWTGVPPVTVVGITTGNTLEALIGAYLLAQVGFRPSLERLRDVLALLGLAALVSTMVSATVGVSSLLLGDAIDADRFGVVWRTWWLGDMGGDVIVAPLILVAVTHWPYRRAPGRGWEALALGAVLVLLSGYVFSKEMGLTYLVFPPLIWAALRFWQPGAAVASLTVAAIAVWYTQDGEGPFLRSSPDDSLLMAQTFAGVSGLTALLLATATSQRVRAERAVQHIARTLEESLLPSSMPTIPAVDVAVRFLPAGEPHRVGGDFYDVFATGDHSWGIVVGDVCGKGPEAAAVTGLARHTIRAAALHERGPSAILRLLNTAIREQPGRQELCSAAFARLEVAGSMPARLTVSSAGHPLPIVLRSDATVEVLGGPGTLLGVTEDPTLEDTACELASGDAVVLYTDGLLDAYAPARTYRGSDVRALVASCAGMGADAMVERIAGTLLAVEDAAPRDDIAILAVRRR
jgi:integral membrane sensor domain MASE1/serine phosphatase RsbU (regulator of sigma subunit)